MTLKSVGDDKEKVTKLRPIKEYHKEEDERKKKKEK